MSVWFLAISGAAYGAVPEPEGLAVTASPSNALLMEFGETDRERFSAILKLARERESRMTGETPEAIPAGRFLVTDQADNDVRILTAVLGRADGTACEFSVIGKNFVPNGIGLTAWFGEEIEYSNSLEAVIEAGEDVYYAARISAGRTRSEEACAHQWAEGSGGSGSCLRKERRVYFCSRCGAKREVFTAPLGHVDEDGDSICDRCQSRAIPQKLGSRITADLDGRELVFTCIAEDYQGGMLYLADEALELEFFGGYGAADYGESNPYRYFRDGFQNGFSIKCGILPVEGAYAMSLSLEEYEAFRERIKGGGFLLRDNQGEAVWGVDENGDRILQNAASTGFGIRPAIVLEQPEKGMPDPIHWNLGDLQARELDGQTYLFRCIDQNYTDGSQNQTQAALFLCESVIPADHGSGYELVEDEDGGHRYEFRPGPLVRFGDSSEYRDSDVHRWLEGWEADFYTVPVNVGVDYAYTGSTPEGEFSAFDANGLTAHYLGDQKLVSKLFLLSVDEAVRYRDALWRFDGADRDNPESQYSAYSKGYWLRTPMGTGQDPNGGYVYAVDLVKGNIRPWAVKSGENGGEGPENVSTIGVRPAFVMPQDTLFEEENG